MAVDGIDERAIKIKNQMGKACHIQKKGMEIIHALTNYYLKSKEPWLAAVPSGKLCREG